GTTGGTGGALDEPCSTENGIDTCVAVGLVCQYSTDPAHMGTVCELPGEFQPCQVGVGCNGPSLECLAFSTGSFCFIPCASTSDCTTLYTTCQVSPPICYVASCATGAGADGGFALCDAAGVGDGTCLPETGATASEPARDRTIPGPKACALTRAAPANPADRDRLCARRDSSRWPTQ